MSRNWKSITEATCNRDDLISFLKNEGANSRVVISRLLTETWDLVKQAKLQSEIDRREEICPPNLFERIIESQSRIDCD